MHATHFSVALATIRAMPSIVRKAKKQKSLASRRAGFHLLFRK
jgi:hypothetical protein